jgi:hypothetical protein
MTLCHPLPYGSHPSKKDGGTLEKGMDAYLTPARDDDVMFD